MAPATGARALLLDTWVTDGRRGYFICPAWNAEGAPLSLYDTRWNLRLAQRQVPGSAGICAARVRSWASPALDGALARSGLPAIAQLAYVVDILRMLGDPVDAGRVRSTLESLRRGGGYCSMPAAAAPDWGSTALAVEVQAELGMDVPATVVAAAGEALGKLAAGAPGLAATGKVAMVQIAASLGGWLDRKLLAWALSGLAGEVAAVLAALPVAPATLSLLAALRAATSGQAGVGWLPGRVTGGRPPDSETRVGLPARLALDPQARCCALELGYGGGPAAAVPPRSRAGWPWRHAAAGAVAASVTALRQAAGLGMHGRFIEPLRRQLDEVWLPSAGRRLVPGSGPPMTAADAAALPELAGLLVEAAE